MRGKIWLEPCSWLLLYNIFYSGPEVSRVPALLIRVRPENLPPHEAPRCSAAREQLELGKPLLWQDVEAVHRHPASVGFSVALI